MLGLYIFGKSFAQVKRFIGSKSGLATNKSFHLSKALSNDI
jgi:hypothetical protein